MRVHICMYIYIFIYICVSVVVYIEAYAYVCISIYTHLNSNNPVYAIYINLQKAFDSVVHIKLLQILSAICIPPLLISWTAAFLANRSQQVPVGHCLSAPSRVLSGVSQCSVLSPVLFILFINDHEYVLASKAKFKLFADDLTLYSSFRAIIRTQSKSPFIWFLLGLQLGSFQLTTPNHNAFILVLSRISIPRKLVAAKSLHTYRFRHYYYFKT